MTRQYPADLVRVVDGDTVILRVDLGFRVFAEIDFRLARINTPELGTPGAEEAKAFTEKWCQGPLLVRTSKGDRYGRWIAEVIRTMYLASEQGNLSDALLAAGLAEPYPKPKEKP